MDELRRILEAHWAAVRRALGEYRLDDLRRLLHLPPEVPAPPRGQAQEFLKQLPDFGASRFLKIVQERDRAGYVARTHLDQAGTTITIVRFRRAGAGWELVPAPETLSSLALDTALDEAAVAVEVDTQPILRLFPPGEMTMAPAAAPDEPADERPEAEIRAELEEIWARIRRTGASDPAVWDVEGRGLPPPERLPDLAGTRFDKLCWNPDKPDLVGYIAVRKPSTALLIVFVRKDGAYRFVPGPASIEVVGLPPGSEAELHARIDADPRLRL